MSWSQKIYLYYSFKVLISIFKITDLLKHVNKKNMLRRVRDKTKIIFKKTKQIKIKNQHKTYKCAINIIK